MNPATSFSGGGAGALPMVAALYVEAGGCYYGLPNVDCWDEARDARLYDGPWPVVAHPPCERWGKYWGGSPTVIARTGQRKTKGDDGGCFEAALASVRQWGGGVRASRRKLCVEALWIECADARRLDNGRLAGRLDVPGRARCLWASSAQGDMAICLPRRSAAARMGPRAGRVCPPRAWLSFGRGTGAQKGAGCPPWRHRAAVAQSQGAHSIALPRPTDRHGPHRHPPNRRCCD